MKKNIKVDWRASKNNAAYLSSLTNYIIDQFGKDSQESSEFKTIEQGVQKAYCNHEIFYTEHTATQSTSNLPAHNPVTAKIIVVTASRNVSSCLDFIDEIKAVDPKTLLIGQITDADSIYMKVRIIDLPSNIGKLQFPIKMYHNRPRGHNIPYIPDLTSPENIISQEERDQWLQETISNL